jgi:hypothetical protein
MKTKLLLFSFSFACCVSLSAQDTARLVDRVITNYDQVYTGHITDDVKGDYLVIDVGDKGSYTLSYTNITKVQYGIENPRYARAKHLDPAAPKAKKDDDLIAFNGYRASPQVTDKLIKKRNVGIGLAVAGMTLVGVGAVMYAAIPKQSITNSGGYQYLSPSPGSIAGVLMIIGGIGITIPGAIIWGRNAHKIHKAEQEL